REQILVKHAQAQIHTVREETISYVPSTYLTEIT
uniref:Dystrophin (Fragments) n=1 Tax=Oryctolagus cuniculus TaxID=9986 RepID=Q7M2K7_RABIT